MAANVPLTVVESLSDSIDDLEDTLAPLLAQPLPDVLKSLDLMQSAQLDVALAYAIHDLLWIYLRCKGVDTPANHPVTHELNRLRGYYRKLSSTTAASSSSAKQSKSSQTSKKSKTSKQPNQHKAQQDNRHTRLDKAAAGRFVKHALSAAQIQAAEIQASGGEGASGAGARDVVNPNAGLGRMSGLKWLASKPKRLEARQDGDGEDEDEESELEVIDDVRDEDGQEEDDSEEDDDDDAPPVPASSKLPTENPAKGEREPNGKRARIDPFAGYDGADAPWGQATKRRRRE